LIFERIGIAACCKEPLPEMLRTDDSEMLRGNWLAVLAHGCQQLGDSSAVDLIGAEELS
jgi:hypothetical protein